MYSHSVRARGSADHLLLPLALLPDADQDGKEYTIPGNPIKISGFEGVDAAVKPPAPALDEHGAAIRASLTAKARL